MPFVSKAQAKFMFAKHPEMAKEFASAEQLMISFMGIYSQARQANPHLELKTPFVIAQDESQRNLLNGGKLEGIIFECPKTATIQNGRMGKDFIKFDKLYLPSGIPFLNVNPNPIIYSGISQDAINYSGTWEFNSYIGDMCKTGNFQLQRV